MFENSPFEINENSEKRYYHGWINALVRFYYFIQEGFNQLNNGRNLLYSLILLAGYLGIKEGKNLFYEKDGKNGLSEVAHKFITGILHYAKDLCLLTCPSVNAYRRLDPAFEAPNEIKVSSVDRGSMVRIPIGNERSARMEIRTVAPDARPGRTRLESARRSPTRPPGAPCARLDRG